MPMDDPWFDGESYLPVPDEGQKTDYNPDEFIKIIWGSEKGNVSWWFALKKADFDRYMNRFGLFDFSRAVMYGAGLEPGISYIPISQYDLEGTRVLYLRQVYTSRAQKADVRRVRDEFGSTIAKLWETYRPLVAENHFSVLPNTRARVRTGGPNISKSTDTTQSTTDTTQENTIVKNSRSSQTISGHYVVGTLELKEGWVGQVTFEDQIVWQSEPLAEDYDPESKIYGEKSLQAAKDKVTSVVTALFASE